MIILELQNLKKYYSAQRAVDDISFSIPRETIFGLLGPNGAGKTTLLRMITGIFYPDSGNILFEGKKFDPTKDIPKIGYMPEERGLYKKMKIGEQALYLAMLKGMSRADALKNVKEWFVKFGQPATACWYVPFGHRPSIEEAVERLAHLQANGPTQHAFDFRTKFAMPESR